MEIFDWLRDFMLPCLWKSMFGIECPGCGLQRSFIALLQGNLAESFRLFPALIPMLIAITFGILNRIFRFKYGSRITFWLLLGTVIIVFVSYFYRQGCAIAAG